MRDRDSSALGLHFTLAPRLGVTLPARIGSG